MHRFVVPSPSLIDKIHPRHVFSIPEFSTRAALNLVQYQSGRTKTWAAVVGKSTNTNGFVESPQFLRVRRVRNSKFDPSSGGLLRITPTDTSDRFFILYSYHETYDWRPEIWESRPVPRLDGREHLKVLNVAATVKSFINYLPLKDAFTIRLSVGRKIGIRSTADCRTLDCHHRDSRGFRKIQITFQRAAKRMALRMNTARMLSVSFPYL